MRALCPWPGAPPSTEPAQTTKRRARGPAFSRVATCRYRVQRSTGNTLDLESTDTAESLAALTASASTSARSRVLVSAGATLDLESTDTADSLAALTASASTSARLRTSAWADTLATAARAANKRAVS